MNKLFYAISIIALSLFTACSDWLDVKPLSQEREKDMFKTYSGFKDALTGCYASMSARNLYGQRLTISDIEELACLWIEPTHNTYAVWRHFYNHRYQEASSEEVIKWIYGGLYNVIAQANMVIEHSDKDQKVFPSDKARNIITGEAFAIRAFCHLDVLRLFGQMPKNAQKQVELPYAQHTGINYQAPYLNFQDYVTQLESDLNEAEQHLKDVDPILQYNYDALNKMGDNAVTLEDDYLQFRQFRLNYFAVKALKARFYLYVGQQEKAYQEAKAVINAKVNNAPFMELSGKRDIANHYFTLPNECIFALSNNKLTDYTTELLWGYAEQVNSETNLVITSDMLDKQLYEGANTSSDNRYLHVWNKTSSDVTGTKYPTTLKYYYPVNEYDKENKLSELITRLQLMPLIRLSEIYLIAMETTTDLAEGNALYKTYMAARNVNITQNFASLEDLHQEIFREYHREFYAEGVMFYTYKRLGTKKLMFSSTPMTEAAYILPLPTSEYNPNTQNANNQ